jgi:pyruvate formate lyase activating enzyme
MEYNQKEAMLYAKESDGTVICQLCFHRCSISVGHKGSCQVRENHNGSLYTLAYGQNLIQSVDTVEKKPLFHFHPGSTAYSIAHAGCNFRCQYCINWELSQAPRHGDLPLLGSTVSPEQVVGFAQNADCQSIAYTYTEPTIFFEFVYDTARFAHSAGLRNICKTNGFMTDEMMDLFEPYLDAANVDLKTFKDETYKRFGGLLQPVLDNLKRMKRSGIWLEVYTVIIPGVNDEPAELEQMAEFINKELGSDTPWHLTRFFPAYELLDLPPTPIETMHRAYEIGSAAGLTYIYFGNLIETGKQDTRCKNCDHLLIRRRGSNLLANHIIDNHCPQCSERLWSIRTD